ncbi:hypothetical protein EON77_01840 [bacterium]|nr:MAG: hypothetical protein EON77_01840 [bacterium]
MRAFGLFLLAPLMAGVTLWSFLVKDAAGFQNPAFARIFFWHFPCPILATILLALGAYFSYRAINAPADDLGKMERWDVRSQAAHELAMVFITLTLLTGILFSKLQWGAYWQNDPRQMSFLVVFGVYVSWFVLRGAQSDPDRKIRTSAGYALVAFAPAMFLTFVFPRLPQIAQTSFHPTASIMEGQIKGAYAQVLLSVMILVAVLAAWCYRLRVTAGLLELDLETRHAELDPRRHSSDPVVVRPVRLSDPSGS